jgi:hypothetical protein
MRMRTRSRMLVMEQDIHKLGVWLEKVCQEGVAIENKILELKLAEEKGKKKIQSTQRAKAS